MIRRPPRSPLFPHPPLFRSIRAYRPGHPRINDGFPRRVRQLPPGPQGLPIEIYCFTDTTGWEVYEGIQADIFDHLLAIAPEFHLKLFQEPSGSDFAAVIGASSEE